MAFNCLACSSARENAMAIAITESILNRSRNPAVSNSIQMAIEWHTIGSIPRHHARKLVFAVMHREDDTGDGGTQSERQ